MHRFKSKSPPCWEGDTLSPYLTRRGLRPLALDPLAVKTCRRPWWKGGNALSRLQSLGSLVISCDRDPAMTDFHTYLQAYRLRQGLRPHSQRHVYPFHVVSKVLFAPRCTAPYWIRHCYAIYSSSVDNSWVKKLGSDNNVTISQFTASSTSLTCYLAF